MNYHNIKTDDMLNGDGLRVTCWVSGCNVRCPNCYNPQTWDFDSGIPFTETTMQEIISELAKPYIKGLTLSGGHPLELQNISKVLDIIKRVKTTFPNKDIWVYSGFRYEYIVKDSTLQEALKYIDVIVDGMYIDKMKDINLHFRGSRNQRLIDVQQSLAKNEIILWKE